MTKNQYNRNKKTLKFLGINSKNVWQKERTAKADADYLIKNFGAKMTDFTNGDSADNWAHDVLYCYAVVQFETREDAEKAIQILHGV